MFVRLPRGMCATRSNRTLFMLLLFLMFYACVCVFDVFDDFSCVCVCDAFAVIVSFLCLFDAFFDGLDFAFF